MKFGYDPTPWVYSEESGEYIRLWWDEYLDEEGCTLSDLYREVKAFEEAVDAAVLEDVTAEIEGEEVYSEVEHEYNALLTAYGDCERCVYGMQGECHLQCNN